jgi:hypothetical protein
VGTDYVQFSVVNPNNPIGANSAIQLRFASLGSLCVPVECSGGSCRGRVGRTVPASLIAPIRSP